MKDYAKEAIKFILNIPISPGDPVFVGFSGGKDSVCVEHLMKLSGINYALYYSFTGIDPPQIVSFIRQNYPECTFLKPLRTFWKNLSTNTPPSRRLRWCCTALKKQPADKLPHMHRVMGTRAEESTTRSHLPRINMFYKTQQIHYYPILDWKEWQVWEFIDDCSLQYSSLYDDAFSRLGCIVCPYHSKGLHDQYRKRWPEYFSRFEFGITELYYKRVSQGKTMHYPTPMEFLHNWYESSSARWYAE